MQKLLFLFSFCLLLSCEKLPKNKVAFYYWKTIFKLSKKEQETLEKTKCNTLYIRYFDVALQNKKPLPVSPIQFTTLPKNSKIIPTVFIKNEVFLEANTQPKILAKNITNLITKINTTHKIKNSEIQIDCDWSLESKDKYLLFLKELKTIYKKTISATIRLHQVKYYQKTKIPPVDYGVLMLYNIGSINAKGEKAIYDKKIALQYLPYLKKYPLPLKTALPIFSWLVHTRDQKVLQIISKKSIADYKNKGIFDSQNHKHIVKKNTLAFGNFYKKNDVLFEESITPKDIEEMKVLLQKHSKYPQNEFIYYDLDEKNLNKFTYDAVF